MLVDYRKRCVVRGETHDRVVYGLTAAEYSAASGFDDAVDVADRFDGLSSTRALAEVRPVAYFYTPGLRDEAVREAQRGRIRR
jgi:hypothetical protein